MSSVMVDEAMKRADGHAAEPTPESPPELAEHEDIHLPSPSIAPLIVGIGVALVALGLLVKPLLVVGALLAVTGLWRMGHFPEVEMGGRWLPQLNNRKLGMWVFLSSEVLFFSSLIAMFVTFKIRDGFEEAHKILNLPLATVGTTVLIVSSFAVVMGLEAIQSSDRRVFRNWMLVTLALGLTFVSIQAFEWSELFREDITAKTLFGTAFYVTTGFHGMHVLGGVGWLALLLIKERQGDYSAENFLGVELFGLYWHFVDVVWIVLFTIIYLIH